MFKSQGMHVNTEESPPEVFQLYDVSYVLCVSLVSLFWCVSVCAILFLIRLRSCKSPAFDWMHIFSTFASTFFFLLSIEINAQRQNFYLLKTGSNVQVCLMCMWCVSSSLIKFCVHHSLQSVCFSSSSLGSTGGAALTLGGSNGSSWGHTRGEYLGFLGTSVKDFSS